MTDATGHRDRPGIGPLNPTGITMNGIPTDHYQFQNPQTGKFEVVKVAPAGTPDEVVREFDSFFELQNWVNDKWNQDGYTQAISSQKREANAMVVEMMLPAGRNAEEPQHHSAPSGKEKEEVEAVNR